MSSLVTEDRSRYTGQMKISIQRHIPQHLLSRLVGYLANARWRWLKNTMIRWFIRRYNVDITQAKFESLDQYPSFNAFFTRQLKDGVRSFDHPDHTVLMPADGVLSQFGLIQDGACVQAKGFDYTVSDLLADRTLATYFDRGSFATVYLSPRDYHRVHMPITGTLRQMIYVPGRLFSVNTQTASALPGLFTRNERVVCLFDTEAGPMAMVLVGAMIVASVFTAWHGQVAPSSLRHTSVWDYSDQNIVLARGDEMGYFQMGSTVIVLFAERTVEFDTYLRNTLPVQLGQPMAYLSE